MINVLFIFEAFFSIPKGTRHFIIAAVLSHVWRLKKGE